MRPPYDGQTRAVLAVATLLSGGAALIFETLWTRSLGLVLGSTVEAASASFAALLMGLALGANLGGRLCRRVRRFWAACAALEFAIAIAGTAIGLLLHTRTSELALLLSTASDRHAALPAFLAAFLLLALPAIGMGATFPLLVALAKERGAPPRTVAALYGWNTLGAAAGTLACGFVTLRLLGVRASLYLAAGLDLLAALAFLTLASKAESSVGNISPAEPGTGLPAPRPATSEEALLLTVSAVSGFCVLALEMIWLRLSGYFVGNRTYAVSTLLAAVLLSLSLASALASRAHASSRRLGPATLGLLFLAAALAIPLSMSATDWWVHHQEAREPLLPGGGDWLLFHRFAQTLLLSAPAFIPLGMIFPLAMMLSRRAESEPGQAEGHYFWINTTGCVAGSLLFGFGDMVSLGSIACAGLVALLASLAALACFLAAIQRGDRRLGPAGLILGLGLAWFNLSPGPPIVLLGQGERLLLRREDAYGAFQVVARGGLTKVYNNRTELVFHLGPIITSYVQQMQAHLGMAYLPAARRVLVLGSGYGITAGAFTVYPGVTKIDAVEILPAFVEATDLFAAYNFEYQKHSRVSLVVDDGRHFLTRASERYDIISVNVSDPHLPGGAALFHREFYELAKERLRPGGLLLQHAFGSEVRAVLATLAASFADVRLFPGYRRGFIAVASDRPLKLDAVEAGRLFATPSVTSALEGIGFIPPLDPVRAMARGWSRETRPGLFGEPSQIATDDRPIIEFAWSPDARQLLHSNE